MKGKEVEKEDKLASGSDWSASCRTTRAVFGNKFAGRYALHEPGKRRGRKGHWRQGKNQGARGMGMMTATGVRSAVEQHQCDWFADDKHWKREDHQAE